MSDYDKEFWGDEKMTCENISEKTKIACDVNGTPYSIEATGSEAEHIVELLSVEQDYILMDSNAVLNNIMKYAKLHKILRDYREVLQQHEFFEDLYSWEVEKIYRNCKVDNNTLYDKEGNILSSCGGCMNEKIPYFVNQSTGYLCDNYYGSMFVKVDNNNTFVEISYSC